MTASMGQDGTLVWDRPADRLRDRAEQAYARVRDNAALTADARQAFLAEAFVKLQADMAQLQASAGTATAADVAALKRTLFGVDDLLRSASPSDAATIMISFRDAADRAGRIESEAEAMELLDTATATGDELLARAVGNVSLQGVFGFGYTDVAEKYLADRPDKAAAYTALQEASRPQSVATMWEYVTPAPPEFAGLSESGITLLAEQAAALRPGLTG